jgi:hypothetical protein
MGVENKNVHSDDGCLVYMICLINTKTVLIGCYFYEMNVKTFMIGC